jgi:hypothetical protein
MTFKKVIKCQQHRGEIVARIEREPDRGKVVVYSMRTVVAPGYVAGPGRAPEPGDEIRLRLDDERIRRGKIPYIVTWCTPCRGELVIPIDWLLDEAKHSGMAVCPSTVLPS